MKDRMKYLIAVLLAVIVVGFALERGTVWADLVRPGILVCITMWIVGLVALLHRRDIDIHTKLSWVVTILLLNAVGAILYFIFGPDSTPNNTHESIGEELANPSE